MSGANPGTRGRFSTTSIAALALLLLSVPAAGSGVLDTPATRDADVWRQTQKVTPDDADEPGWNGYPSHKSVWFGSGEIDADGDTMVVGTSEDACSTAPWAYVFERRVDGAWDEVAKLEPPEYPPVEEGDCSSGFGFATAVDEDAGLLAVGDPSFEGTVYLYARTSSGEWEKTVVIEYPGDPVSGIEYARFGFSVDLADDTLVVGAPIAGPNGIASGEVYIFQRSPDGWAEVQRFSGEVSSQLLGQFVTISGDLVAAGAPGEDTSSGDSSGVVHLYEPGDKGWTQVARVIPPEPVVGSSTGSFGETIDLDAQEDTLVVGDSWSEVIGPVGPDQPIMRTYNAGAVYVFERDSDGWGLDARLQNPDPLPREYFGGDVMVNDAGNRVVVGALGDGAEARAGAAYVYEAMGDDWQFTTRLQSNETSPEDLFGTEVAISGSDVIVSAPSDANRRQGGPAVLSDTKNIWFPGAEPEDGEGAGSVYVFRQLSLDSEGAVR